MFKTKILTIALMGSALIAAPASAQLLGGNAGGGVGGMVSGTLGGGANGGLLGNGSIVGNAIARSARPRSTW
jgi:hypothetical protein